MDDTLVIQTAQNVDLAFSPAGLGERILAWLVDAALAAAYGFSLTLLPLDGIGTAGSVVILAPFLLYHLVCEVFFEGQTAGKRLLQIQVARLDGAPPTLGQYLLRWLFRFVDVTFSSGVVAVVAVAATRQSQRLGDVVAGTTVVRRKRRVGLDEVRYPVRPPDYAPAFPDAVRLTDADVRTLRAVLVRLRRGARSKAALALGRRAKTAVERRLDLPPVAMPPEAFIQTVVADYTALHDRYAGEG